MCGSVRGGGPEEVQRLGLRCGLVGEEDQIKSMADTQVLVSYSRLYIRGRVYSRAHASVPASLRLHSGVLLHLSPADL